jgi:hypothetical protein
MSTNQHNAIPMEFQQVDETLYCKNQQKCCLTKNGNHKSYHQRSNYSIIALIDFAHVSTIFKGFSKIEIEN